MLFRSIVAPSHTAPVRQPGPVVGEGVCAKATDPADWVEMMKVSVIGISHRTAPVEVRERFALPGELARRFLRSVRAEGVFDEALVLDTCNRTEVYFVCGMTRTRWITCSIASRD